MPSQPLHRQATAIEMNRLSLLGILARSLLAVLWLGAPAAAQQSSLPAPPTPSWQSGQSNWNGRNYETLPTPAPQVAPARPEPTITPPIRVDTPQELPAEWQENFGLSPPSAPRSVMEDLPLSDPLSLSEPRTLSDGVVLTDPSGEFAGDTYLEPESLSDRAIGTGVIGTGLAESANPETPPLEEEIVRWYEIPWRWVRQGWTSHAELGLNGSDGNSVTTAIQTGLEMNRKTDIDTLGIDFNYRQASTQRTNTENNARLNIDYDRLLGESNWTSFGKLGLAYDKFKAFDLRLNLNTGFGYYWLRNDQVNFITRAGLGASREFGAPDDRWTPEAVLGLSYDHQLSERQKIIAKLDYFPSLRDLGDYRVVADLAWETLIDTSENLSLRLSVTDRYDSTPQGALPNDVYYAALLLYKF